MSFLLYSCDKQKNALKMLFTYMWWVYRSCYGVLPVYWVGVAW